VKTLNCPSPSPSPAEYVRRHLPADLLHVDVPVPALPHSHIHVIQLAKPRRIIHYFRKQDNYALNRHGATYSRPTRHIGHDQALRANLTIAGWRPFSTAGRACTS
jgi:hypothetical protein